MYKKFYIMSLSCVGLVFMQQYNCSRKSCKKNISFMGKENSSYLNASFLFIYLFATDDANCF